MIVAETNRLLILKFTLKDAPFFLELVNAPNWIKYIGDRNTKTVKAAEERIQEGHLKSYQSTGFGFYKLLLKTENNKPIGTCGLIKRDTLDDVDIGFAMLPGYEGLGLAHEASKEVIKLAKQQFELKRLIAIINPDNKKSIKLIEKLGFTFEKLVKPFADDEELLLFAKTL
ncbi:GNAT family N-acetyltransferase [Algibacter pectinivorans]|uniref:Protein N-acetyltransferase, RimJ/RimL family n=1 Tax=Algibacter pectinivorans TaxID=870482 RepID=A0A1I1NN88_9FLAO|nr:GNAT family N-acetyltransferase [Algibacter pectinivorans]SFC99121.1 Protein N-acetyltransferase, RimJ/RimL family [Algibacter pectinivorans]